MTFNNIFLTLTFDLSSGAEIKVFPISSFLPAFILSLVLLDSSEQSSRWNEMHEAIWIIQLFGYGLLACYAGRGERNEDLKCIESTHYWTDRRRKWLFEANNWWQSKLRPTSGILEELGQEALPRWAGLVPAEVLDVVIVRLGLIAGWSRGRSVSRGHCDIIWSSGESPGLRVSAGADRRGLEAGVLRGVLLETQRSQKSSRSLWRLLGRTRKVQRLDL